MIVRFAGRKNGQRTPETHLWLEYPAAVLSKIGLIVWGVSVEESRPLDHRTDCPVSVRGVASQVGNMKMSSYIVDSYAEHAIEVVTFHSKVINVNAVSISLTVLC
jgi:hypothetical protein